MLSAHGILQVLKKQTYYVVKDFINKRGSEVIPFQLKLLTLNSTLSLKCLPRGAHSAIWMDLYLSSLSEMITDFDGHVEMNVKNYFNMFLKLSNCFQYDILANTYFWWEAAPSHYCLSLCSAILSSGLQQIVLLSFGVSGTFKCIALGFRAKADSVRPPPTHTHTV